MKLSPEEKERFDQLSTDDQLKLQAIFQMMKDEKDAMKENNEAVELAVERSEEAAGIKEAREFSPIDRKVSTRIEGLLDIGAKKKFLDAWEDLYYDLVDDEPFDLEDVVAYLSNEMGNAILGNPVAMDKLDEEVKNRDIRTALKQDAKGTDAEIDSYFTSLMKAGDTFDTMEDYVEDFKNYVADKSLQEHFKRFI